MKIFSKLFFITLAILFSANCGKRMHTTTNPANAYILADSIRQASTGNCAISINLESLYHGAIVKSAVTSGAGNTTQTPNVFDLADYNAATGEDIAAADWANISYNRKFDAFWTNGGDWNDEARNAVLKRSASITNAASILGAALVIANGLGVATACGGGNTQYVAAVEAYYNLFTDEEKTEINAGSATNPRGLWAVIFSATGSVTTANSLATFTNLKTALQGSCGGTIATLSPGAPTLGSAYLAGQARKNGAALLACTRIPRSGCSFGGLTTASLDDAKKFQAAVYEALQNNGDCRKPTDAFMINNANRFFTGLSEKDELKAAGITFKGGMQIKDDGTKLSQGSTTSFSGNILYARRAYPLSGALASVSSSFVDAFPLKEGTVAYNDTTFSGGSNVNAKAVESCDTLGLAVNPVPSADDTTRKKLTPPAEIVYALSVNGVAAQTYAGIVLPFGAVDAVACNKSFRKKTSLPPSLNAKLPELDTVAGDGGTTGLTSLCVYGKDSTTVSTVAGILGGSISGIAACPASAKEGASTFANSGLNSITSSFPNKE